MVFMSMKNEIVIKAAFCSSCSTGSVIAYSHSPSGHWTNCPGWSIWLLLMLTSIIGRGRNIPAATGRSLDAQRCPESLTSSCAWAGEESRPQACHSPPQLRRHPLWWVSGLTRSKGHAPQVPAPVAPCQAQRPDTAGQCRGEKKGRHNY